MKAGEWGCSCPSESVDGGCGWRAVLSVCVFLFFFFSKHQQGIQKTPTEEQAPVLIDIVCSHRRKAGACRRGRAPLHTGVLKGWKKKTLKGWNHWTLVIRLHLKWLTGGELWRSEPGEQDTGTLYQGQEDTPHGCRAHHGYGSICNTPATLKALFPSFSPE